MTSLWKIRNHVSCIAKRRCLSSATKTRTARVAATTMDPSLYMWGTNVKGGLLGMDVKMVDIPTKVDWRQVLQVDSNISIRQVVCGPTDTAIVLSDGKCFTWGENKSGQLGHGHTNPLEKPTLLPVDVDVRSITLGPNSSALVDTNGDLYTFGFGGSAFSGMGCLGHGDGKSYLSPKLVESLVEDGCYVKDVQVGESHMSVLTTEGEVLTAGAAAFGRLGNLESNDQLYLEPIEMLVNGDVVQIAGGESFTLALTKDGVVHAWGANNKGQLGIGMGLAVDMYAMAAIPTPIETDELVGRTVIKIAAGHSHAACITHGGELFVWGMAQSFEPERMTSLLTSKVVDVFCGKDYTIALSEDGKLHSLGVGKSGVLGIPGEKKLPQPKQIETLANKRVISVSAGWMHVACQVEE